MAVFDSKRTKRWRRGKGMWAGKEGDGVLLKHVTQSTWSKKPLTWIYTLQFIIKGSQNRNSGRKLRQTPQRMLFIALLPCLLSFLLLFDFWDYNCDIPPSKPSQIPPLSFKSMATFFIKCYCMCIYFIVCIYNITCLVCITLLICMFAGLTVRSLIQSRTTCPGGAQLALPHRSLIKKNLALRPIWWKRFIDGGFLFAGDSGLCGVDTNKQHN